MLRPPGGCCCPAVGCQLSLSIQLRQCCSTTGGASSVHVACASAAALFRLPAGASYGIAAAAMHSSSTAGGLLSKCMLHYELCQGITAHDNPPHS
jgi:hypothetical protein